MSITVNITVKLSPGQPARASSGLPSGKEDDLTVSQVVFDPFSDDFFNAPYETYRRLRDEAPVYYSAEYDFYALTRHADVAAGLKDFETFSSSRGIDLEMVQSDDPVPPLVIMMDPPAHRRMRNLVNKVFTPRAIQRQQQMVTEQIERFLASSRPAELRCGARLLRIVSGRGDNRHVGCPAGASPTSPAVAGQATRAGIRQDRNAGGRP